MNGKLKAITTTGGGVLLLAVAILCLNVIASRLYTRVDVTADRVFSLSEGTRKILGRLDDDVTAKLYFSRSIKDLPVPIKTYATRVEEVLGEYAAHSRGKLAVEVIDPKPDTDEEEWAQRYGVTGVRLPKGDQMFFGVVFVAGSREVVIPYLDPRREELLEYDLSEGLVRAFKKERAKVGVMTALPVMTDPWVLVSDLGRSFDVEAVDTAAHEIPDGIQVLMVLHPKGLGVQTQYAIDQFVLRGGRLIVAVDPMARVDLDQSRAMAMGHMPETASDLERLFAAWGVAYDKTKLVGDPALATQINAGGQVLAYPFFLSLGAGSFSETSVVTSRLGQVMIAEGGAFALAEGSPYTLEPLLRTTKESGVANAQMAGFLPPFETAKSLKPDDEERILAGLLRGKLKSAFPEPPTEGAGEKAPERRHPHKAEADQEVAVLLVGDVDFLHDANAVDKFRFGSQTMVRLRNDNLSFLANATDFLGGSEELIAIRSRGRIARPFTRVAEIQKTAQLRWQAEEERLSAELEGLQKKLSELQAQRTDGNRFVLSPAQQAEIERFRDEERKVRQKRREVRKSLREDIEALGRKLVFANLLFVPAACSAVGVGVFVSRSRRMKKGRQHA